MRVPAILEANLHVVETMFVFLLLFPLYYVIMQK
nr:MAG TPA: hypothetical protein [Caudoviricetes sp.]